LHHSSRRFGVPEARGDGWVGERLENVVRRTSDEKANVYAGRRIESQLSRHDVAAGRFVSGTKKLDAGLNGATNDTACSFLCRASR
jgi:hypothetical protein